MIYLNVRVSFHNTLVLPMYVLIFSWNGMDNNEILTLSNASGPIHNPYAKNKR